MNNPNNRSVYSTKSLGDPLIPQKTGSDKRSTIKDP
jgi:hypothetical protein